MAEAPWIGLFHRPLPLEEVMTYALADTAAGGVVNFLGVTRQESDCEHGSLVHLEYEAYFEMAMRQLRGLAAQALDRWGARRIAMHHRLGRVGVGEVSVAIAVACPHRAESFEACRWLIDALKRDVPIWKKDVFEDGFTRWVDPCKQYEPRTW